VTAAVGAPPRVELVHAPTPLEVADRLAAALDKPPHTVLVKRDDATGLALGGNKVRKLEFVLAEALAAGADCLVTGAGVQSNAARATAAAAARFGLGCVLVLDGEPPASVSGNLLLDQLLGAEVVFHPVASNEELELMLEQTAAEQRAAGRRPYVIPVGASTPLGALGYVRAVDELFLQCADLVVEPTVVVVATGSAGTHAGLVAGFGDHARVLGVRVGTRENLADRVDALAAAAAEIAGRDVPRGNAWLDDGQLGEGYGAHTDACIEAMSLAARTEGLILDPVYTGKALAGLVAACRDGRIARDDVVVFCHTGGAPGLLSDGHAPGVAARLRGPVTSGVAAPA
jgi:D-cysteine desulfhydrase family pyridoxal phosphate-dependent enzyme